MSDPTLTPPRASSVEEVAPRQGFEELVGEVLEHVLSTDPVRATMLGEHSRDGELPDLGEEAHGRELEELERLLGCVEALDPAGLTRDQAVDREVLRNALGSCIFSGREIASHRWDPLVAVGTLGAGLNALVSKSFAPLDERLASFRERLAKAPEMLRAAAASLRRCSRPHVEVALQQLEGTVGLLHVWDREAGGDGAHQVAVAAAEEAVRDFARELEERHLPESDEDGWRLGAERFATKVERTLDIDSSAEELREAAGREVVRAHRGMLAAGRRILDRAGASGPDDAPLTGAEREIVLEALDRVCRKHAPREGLVDACRRAVEEVRIWTDNTGWIGSYPDDRLRVELWPEHGRGVAVACLDPPGPFDGDTVESYFYISPVPEDWSDERAESFLREYNTAQVRVLAAHETYPGHFVQQALARRHPSRVRSAFSSGTFVEGWAVYVEELLFEQGFRDGDPTYAMAFWKMRLRSALNALLDHAMHTGARTPEECLEMLLHEGFQERGEAEGKVRRAQLSSAQLSTYFAGVHEVSALRRASERRLGEAFGLPPFHHVLLRQGSVAPRHLRGLMGLGPATA